MTQGHCVQSRDQRGRVRSGGGGRWGGPDTQAPGGQSGVWGAQGEVPRMGGDGSRTADWTLASGESSMGHRLWTRRGDGQGRAGTVQAWTGSGKEPHPLPSMLRDTCADWGSPQRG